MVAGDVGREVGSEGERSKGRGREGGREEQGERAENPRDGDDEMR